MRIGSASFHEVATISEAYVDADNEASFTVSGNANDLEDSVAGDGSVYIVARTQDPVSKLVH